MSRNEFVLYAEIEKLKKELEQQKFNNKHNLSIDQQVSDKIAKLEEENKKLKECVDFYADHDNWYYGNSVDESDHERTGDNREGFVRHLAGKRARQCKKDIGW